MKFDQSISQGQRLAMRFSSTAIGLLLVVSTGCLNPTFIAGLGGNAVPLAPGDTPFVLVRAVNLTSEFTVDLQFKYDAPAYFGFESYTMQNVFPLFGDNAFLLPCPVNEVGLGDPLLPTAPAITLTLPDDSTTEIPGTAFPFALAQSKDFSCGDTVVFTIVDDPTNPYGINVSTGVIDGSTQTGPFSGTDTFELFQLLLTLNGYPPTIVE